MKALKELYHSLQADLCQAVGDKAREMSDSNGKVAIAEWRRIDHGYWREMAADAPLFGSCTPEYMQIYGDGAIGLTYMNCGVEIMRPLSLMGCGDLIRLGDWLQFAEDCSWL